MNDIDQAYLLLLKNKFLGVSQWAEATGYSRAHFTRMVKARYGVPPKAIVDTATMGRIALAAREYPGASATDLAAKAGFAEYSSMAKFVRRKLDMTVTEFRRKVLANTAGY